MSIENLYIKKVLTGMLKPTNELGRVTEGKPCEYGVISVYFDHRMR